MRRSINISPKDVNDHTSSDPKSQNFRRMGDFEGEQDRKDPGLSFDMNSLLFLKCNNVRIKIEVSESCI